MFLVIVSLLLWLVYFGIGIGSHCACPCWFESSGVCSKLPELPPEAGLFGAVPDILGKIYNVFLNKKGVLESTSIEA
jgi:hypothetical protein